MNGDGIEDMLTGSYNPGIVTMFEGTKNGFKPGVEVPQEGYVKRGAQGLPFYHIKSNSYWNFTSVGLADYDGDGLTDLFVSGSGGIRVAKNIGTKTSPKFGRRELLLDVEGKHLTLYEMTPEQLRKQLEYGFPNPSNDMKSYIHPIDWDKDGVMDLLVTSSYCREGQNPVEFFRGVKTDKGIRFEQRKALFTAENGQKVFPGSCPMVSVVDYNNDGVKDLLWGLSIVTRPMGEGFEIYNPLSWTPEYKLGIEQPGKDKGRYVKDPVAAFNKEKAMYEKIAKSNPDFKVPEAFTKEITEEAKIRMTIRHRGYIYVMLGKENSTKAEAKAEAKARDYVMPEYYKVDANSLAGKSKGPVTYSIEYPKNISFGSGLDFTVNFKLKEGWYLYADTKSNKEHGYLITKVKFDLPKGFKPMGEMETPMHISKGGADIINQSPAKFTQTYSMGWGVKPGKYKVKATIYYQTCNKSGCNAPVEEKVNFNIEYKR